MLQEVQYKKILAAFDAIDYLITVHTKETDRHLAHFREQGIEILTAVM